MRPIRSNMKAWDEFLKVFQRAWIEWHSEPTPHRLWSKPCAQRALRPRSWRTEDAGIRGLCAEGRWEAALAAIRHVDFSGVVEPPAGSGHAD